MFSDFKCVEIFIKIIQFFRYFFQDKKVPKADKVRALCIIIRMYDSPTKYNTKDL